MHLTKRSVKLILNVLQGTVHYCRYESVALAFSLWSEFGTPLLSSLLPSLALNKYLTLFEGVFCFRQNLFPLNTLP